MFRKEFDIAILISLYQRGALSAEQDRQLQRWLSDDPAHRRLMDELMQNEQLKIKLEGFRRFDEAGAWRRLTDEIALHPVEKHSRLKFKWQFITAAAAALMLVTGLAFYLGRDTPGLVKSKEMVLANVSPGKQSATLTLANGKKIILSDGVNGELARESGLSIKKTVDGQLIYEASDKGGKQPSANEMTNGTNTLSTANGETYRINLPDGSLVWLNAASSLTYKASMAGGQQRRVVLKGEAYFEVHKDKDRPFFVETAGQNVEVLGTHFNVSSYEEEPAIRTTLLEGMVRIATKHKVVILRPGQQSVLTSRNLEVRNVDAEGAIDWKNGYFDFNDEPLESVMRKISRWYRVNVYYPDESVKKETFTGSISRYEQASKVLALLERTGVLHFKLDKDNVTVLKK